MRDNGEDVEDIPSVELAERSLLIEADPRRAALSHSVTWGVSQTAAESNVQLTVMCDPTEGQSNEVQETTEPTPAPVESEAPEGAQKEQAGAEEQKETSQSETEEQKETSQSVNEEQKDEKDETKKSESSTTCLTNESNSGESDIEDANRKTAKTVAGILARVKNDTEMSDMEKIDTLCLLLSKFVEENGV